MNLEEQKRFMTAVFEDLLTNQFNVQYLAKRAGISIEQAAQVTHLMMEKGIFSYVYEMTPFTKSRLTDSAKKIFACELVDATWAGITEEEIV